MANLDLTKLADFAYLFDRRPNPDSGLIFALAILFALAMIVSGIVWLTLIRKESALPPLTSVRISWVQFLFSFGFVGLLLVFFRWQGIPYFSARLWLLTWLLVALGWTGRLTYHLLKKFPQERRLFEDQELRERYLPKKEVRRGPA